MKKSLRLIALLLALVMLFGVTALAVENDKMTITGIDGTTVTFDTTIDEKINVTYESDAIKAGQFYLVMVVAKGEDDTYVPTKDTILYINQTVGEDGVLKFGSETDNAIYPSTIMDSAILIYGTDINPDGEATNYLIAAIIEGKYILGDVNGDKRVNTRDAMLILQHVVGINTLTETQKTPANTNGDKNVNTRDAMLILQLVVGIITEL